MEFDKKKNQKIRNEILIWFHKSGRDFPWRKSNTTNYQKIIVEILLQRTKAETVSNYYYSFFEKYRNWEELWNAQKEDLAELLKPLGLYQQTATRLFNLAQEIKKRNGNLPLNRNEIEELPMMGQYITNAYELFILNRKRPLLDVNIVRVLERINGKRKLADIRYDKILQKVAHELVDHNEAIKINWAVLDYAQVVCKLKKPLCGNCNLWNICLHYQQIVSKTFVNISS